MIGVSSGIAIISPDRGDGGGGGSDLTVKEVSAASYTVLASDMNKELRFTNVAGCAVTFPALVGLTPGASFLMRNAAGGVVTITEDAITINPTDISLEQDQTAGFIYADTDIWDAVLGGDGGGEPEFSNDVFAI